MRVIIGGAHNGKRAYVKTELLQRGMDDYEWFDGLLPSIGNRPVVVAGLEIWLRDCRLDEETAMQEVLNALKNRTAIVILTDVGRGIVPVNADDRTLRDRCGRLNQRLVAEADEVIQVWYGIPKIIKERGYA